MGDTVETDVDRTQRLGYDAEDAKRVLGHYEADVAEQQVIVNWLYQEHDTAERELDRREQRARGVRERLVADGVIPAT